MDKDASYWGLGCDVAKEWEAAASVSSVGAPTEASPGVLTNSVNPVSGIRAVGVCCLAKSPESQNRLSAALNAFHGLWNFTPKFGTCSKRHPRLPLQNRVPGP